jgi:hypothetical protein
MFMQRRGANEMECPGRFLGIIGQNPSVLKSNQVSCCDLSVSLYRFDVCSIDSSKMIGNFHEVMNFSRLFFCKHSSFFVHQN